jgi:hypothetical protein
MKKNPLESFDEAIAILEKAKRLYSQGKHWDAFRTTEKAKDILYKLLCRIELDISLGPKQPDRALSETEKQKLARLNNSLTSLQKNIRKEVHRIVMDCQERMMSPDEDFLSDCEVKVEIQFYLDETDPHYGEDRDSILAEIKLDGKSPSLHEGKNADVEGHCWLYHELYTGVQPSLEWEDLLRIGSIWTDVRIRHQNEVKLSDTSHSERRI